MSLTQYQSTCHPPVFCYSTPYTSPVACPHAPHSSEYQQSEPHTTTRSDSPAAASSQQQDVKHNHPACEKPTPATFSVGYFGCYLYSCQLLKESILFKPAEEFAYLQQML